MKFRLTAASGVGLFLFYPPRRFSFSKLAELMKEAISSVRSGFDFHPTDFGGVIFYPKSDDLSLRKAGEKPRKENPQPER